MFRGAFTKIINTNYINYINLKNQSPINNALLLLADKICIIFSMYFFSVAALASIIID